MNQCTLSPAGLEAQLARAEALRSAIERFDRSTDGFRVRFGASVDADLVSQVVETERACCSFFDIEWDEARRVLSVGSSDREAVAALAAFFEAPA